MLQESTVHKGFENALLDVEITIDDTLQSGAQLGQIPTPLFTPSSLTLLVAGSVRSRR